MREVQNVLFSLLMIGVVVAMAGAGTIAYFSDVETSTGNTFTAGTIDIELDDQDEPFGGDLIESVTSTFIINDWKPSEIGNPGLISIHNKGKNPIGQLILYASKIDDSDDGLKPESEPNTTDGQGAVI